MHMCTCVCACVHVCMCVCMYISITKLHSLSKKDAVHFKIIVVNYTNGNQLSVLKCPILLYKTKKHHETR